MIFYLLLKPSLGGTNPTPIRGLKVLGMKKDGLINELMKGLEPLLKGDVETLGKLEVSVRKYTRPSAEVGQVRWSNFKAILMEKDSKELMERVRYEETTLGLG